MLVGERKRKQEIIEDREVSSCMEDKGNDGKIEGFVLILFLAFVFLLMVLKTWLL